MTTRGINSTQLYILQNSLFVVLYAQKESSLVDYFSKLEPQSYRAMIEVMRTIKSALYATQSTKQSISQRKLWWPHYLSLWVSSELSKILRFNFAGPFFVRLWSSRLFKQFSSRCLTPWRRLFDALLLTYGPNC